MAAELVALLGNPIRQSLSPRMQNAAFAARGLDWLYVACEVEEFEPALRGLQALGFRGANVTIPFKREAAALCDEAEGDSVNTLVLDGGRVLGFNTDKEIVAGIDARVVCLIGAGGAADALLSAFADAEVRTFTRSGTWPPDSTGCDTIVNATPIRDEVVVELRPEHAVVDLAYRGDGAPTALVSAAREAGCRQVVDGLEGLVRQGAAAFERWTGVAAPADVMRAAIGA